MTVSLASLIIQETKAAIYQKAINIAVAVGLPVSSWQAGDPTRSLYHLESEILEALEQVVVNFIRSGFLDYAAEDAAAGGAASQWLKIRAEQDYNVTVPEALYAVADVTLTNTGGGNYADIAPGDLTVKNTSTGKTFHNTTGGDLLPGPGTTLTLTFVADEPGSGSTSGPGEIDDLVTDLLGVECSNDDAAIGVDEQDPSITVQQCRDKLDSLSPDGAKGAYSYVARNAELTGTTAVTRVRTYPDSDTGDVLVYLAGPSGAIGESDRALVEAAILRWCTPLCITPTVQSATNKSIDITYQLWVYKSINKTDAEIKDDIEAAIGEMLLGRDIGGDIIVTGDAGRVYRSLIAGTIEGVSSKVFRVEISVPDIDPELTNSEVAVLGALNGTINQVVDP